MKRLITILSLIVFLAVSLQVGAQSTANYAFSYATNGSLVDISSGATTMLTGNNDDAASSVYDIGFTFVFMGVPYTQFSANSNGQIRLGSTVTAATYSGYTANTSVLAPMSGDNEINNGMSFKVTGTAPNRVLVIEWNQFYVYYTNISNAGNMQALLYEGTGNIEYIYGEIYNSNTSTVTRSIFISASNTANKSGSVTVAATPTYESSATTPTSNTFAASVLIANLASTAQGSRTVYTFTPPAATPNAPTGLNFTGITGTTMTLNWTDNSSDETGFAIFRSTDGINYSYVTNVAASTVTYAATGLSFGTTYYWNVYATNEGKASAPASGTQATNAATLFGIKYIPGDYATIALAVADLNSSGVLAGAGGVTFKVDSNYTESITAPIIIQSTGSGSASDPVVFEKRGVGSNPIVTRTDAGSITTTSLGAQGDAVIIFDGCDYVTFNQINLAASNSGVEYGYYLRKATPTDGCKNVTVKNASITMTKGTSGYVVGIYSSNNDANSSATSATGITLTSTGGRHENVTITGNTIANVFSGIVLRGFSASTPYDLYDQNYTIGASGQGNTIQNFAGNATSSAYGVYLIYVNNANISYNIINNTAGGGSGFTATAYGIFGSTATSANITMTYNQLTLTGAVATSSIYGVNNASGSTAAGNTVEISNNTVTGYTNPSATSGAFYGVQNTASAAYVNMNNNTVSSTTLIGSGALYGVYNTAGATTVNMSGNIFSGNAHNGTGAMTCIYNSASATTVNINGNQVTNNSLAGTGTFTGIDGGGPTNLNIYGNTVSGNSKTGASGSMFCTRGATAIVAYYDNDVFNNTFTASSGTSSCILHGYYNIGSPTVENIYNNEIYNLSVAGTSTASGSLINGINTSTTTSATKNIYGNIIRNFTALSGNINGISQAAGSNVSIYKNQIYNLSNAGSNGVVYGFTIASGTVYAYNNFISDLKAPNANVTDAIRGINITSSTTNSTVGIYYNTIFLNASSIGTNFGSTGIYHTMNTTATTATLDMRDNIIVNASTPNGTGYTVAYRRSGITLTNYSSASNNNDLYAGTPGTYRLLFYDGVNMDQTMDTYKPRVQPRDASSISEDPVFVNESTAPYDLHINTSNPTQLESGGTPVTTPVNVTLDFDGNDRNGTSPDLGADEFDGIGADETAPGISYALIPNTSSTGNRNFNGVEITDMSGVNTDPGTNPRLYFKRKTDANTFNDNTNGSDGWKYDETDGATSPFDFSIDYQLLNGGTGVATGDTIQYFVVAQDIAPTPNVGINAGVFNTEPASVDLAAGNFPITGTINYYAIVTGFSGVYNIGTGQTYRCLTADADTGFFKAINNAAVSGNITVNILNNLNETGAIALNQWIEDGAGNYTMTIKPNDATLKTISGSYAGGLIRLNSADRVTFDGSFAVRSGENYFTITNTATTGTIAAIQLISLGNGQGCTNVTVKDCNISCGHNASGSYAIAAGGLTIASSGPDHDNLIIQGNEITKAYVGIRVQGSAVNNPGLMDNPQILGNKIGSDNSADYIFHDGIYLLYATGGLISENTIYNLIPGTTVTTPVGMTLSTGVVSTVVNKNIIHDIVYTGTGGYGGRGIYINTGNGASNLRLDNNLIYNIKGDGYSGFSASSMVGMYFDGTTGGLDIYYNSVYLSGDFARSTATLTAAILFYTSTLTDIDLRDNILQNSMNNTLVTTDKNYAIYSTAPNTSFSNIDFNDYYTTGSEGILGYLGGDKTTLVAWQAATNQDANSINVDPLYINTTDLTIPSTSPVIGAGIPIAAVDYDILNLDRDDLNPSMGAYEEGLVISCPFPTALVTSIITNSGADMGWTDATGTYWDLYIVPAGDPAPTETSTPTVNDHNATSYTWTGGDGNTDYKWYVRRDCQQDNTNVSLWSGPQTFTTLCDSYSSISENFDAVTAPNIPNCWAKYISPSYSYQTVLTYTTGAYSVPNTVQIYGSGATASADAPMLISPSISNLAAGTHELRFFAKGASSNLSVIVGTMSDPTNAATFTAFQTVTGLNTSTYTECAVSFASYSGTDDYIAFKHPLTTTYSYIYIDNVIWQPLPSCPSPTNFTTTDITATTATLDWTDGNSETLWDVIWGPDGFDPLTQGTLISNIDAHPYLLDPPLSGNTNYDWYVRADCAPGDSSLWSPPVSFKTACEPSAIPWTEGFESLVTVGSGIIPDCMVEVGDWASANTPTTGNRSPHSGTNYIWTNWSANDWFFTPMFELTAGQPYEFSFWYITDGAIPWTVETYFGTSQTSGAMTEAFGSPLINPVNITYDQYTATLVPTVSGTYCVGIHVISTISPDYISFDDLMLDLSTLCPQPASTSTTNITESSADLNWANWPDSFFDVFFGEAGNGPGDEGTTYSGLTGSPLTVTDLESNTDYNWYVRKDCGFDAPNIDNFWMAMPTSGNLNPLLSGGTADDPGETGVWYLYDQAPGGMDWWNIWFYDDPVDTSRMKKIRMGFWVSSYNGIAPGMINYVINWSDTAWDGPGFPTPMDEPFIHRSPVNGPIPIAPGTPHWVELYYVISDYNPEWVSIDIWGDNIIIENIMQAPPVNSPLFSYYDPLTMTGGIIIHECLPKTSSSTWAGPVMFSTTQIAAATPFAETFETLPTGWKIVNGAQPNIWTIGTATAYAGTQSAYISQDNGVTNSYNIDTASIVHVYRDIAFTGGLGGYKLEFFWQGVGEGPNWDRLRVYLVETSVSPVAGTELTSGQIGLTNYNLQATWAGATIDVPGTVTGTTKRLVFSWTNDDNTGEQPPVAVDEIRIGLAPFTWTGAVSNVWSDPGNWNHNLVPDITSKVIIPSDPTSDPNVFPIITSTVSCYSISIGTGAIVTVQSPGILNVLNP